MSLKNPGVRVGLLMAGAAALLFWASHHTEVSFADGLRYVREADRIDRGDLAGGTLRATDHPVHPLAIAAAHRLLGGDGQYAWQYAAQAVAAAALVLAVLPIYLLGRDLFDDGGTAVLGCVLAAANPVVLYVGVNVLSESTFLFFWAWGLWASARFLRAGRFAWLVPAVLCGALAYLTRPEGLLLHLSLVATLLLLPLHSLTRIYWPRWSAAVAVLVVGPVVLVGPYVFAKGGLGTKPAIARVLGTRAEAPASAVEREHPLDPNRTAWQTYGLASARVVKAVRGAVTWPLVPLAALGLIVARPGLAGGELRAGRARTWIFLGVILAASCGGLVRLHATGGYCTVRHALVPGLILTLFAAHGLNWLIRHAAVDGRRLGLGEGVIRPGPAVWAGVLTLLVAWPLYRDQTPYFSSFGVYRMAGSWLAEVSDADADGRVLDLTEWTLYFSGKHGYGVGQVEEAAAQRKPKLRWVVVRDAHLTGNDRSSTQARRLIDGREPYLSFPQQPEPGQVRVFFFNLDKPPTPGVAWTLPALAAATAVRR